MLNMNDTLKDKSVLLIGSGADVDGRAMGAEIDGEAYDIVARVNKPYGAVADVGTRTDIVFVRHAEWVNFFWHRHTAEGEEPASRRVVAFHDGVGCARRYDTAAVAELGFPAAKVSTGLCAAKWLLEHGAKVTVIGFGYRDGAFPSDKTYAETGKKDTNPNFDWQAENAWLREHVTLV